MKEISVRWLRLFAALHTIPHPPPKGVNAGLLLMNLTRMRDYGWENKLLRVYTDYSKLVHLTGQRTFNILLYYDSGLLYALSCHVNFFHRHCDRGFTCKDAVRNGILLVHGNGKKMEPDQLFHGVLQKFKEFSMPNWINKSKGNFISSAKDLLMTPIRDSFKQGPNPCFGSLNHLLFKNFFPESTNYTLANLKSNFSFFSA